MAGGEGVLRQRTAKSVEAAAAAAAGPQAPLRSCSATKRKASGKEAASGPARASRPRASGSRTKEETAAVKAAEAEAEAKQKRRLPAKDVRWILNYELKPPPLRYQKLKRDNPDLVPRPGEENDRDLVRRYVIARAFYERQEKFPKLQERVRREFNEKGYFEVDDEWFERIAEQQAVIDREWPKLVARIDQLSFKEAGGAGDESDSDSEEEEG